MPSSERPSASNRTLYALIALAVIMAAGHHIDHVIRGNNVGWPINSQVNAFTFSLAIYPLILTGLLLHRAGKVGPGFWAFLSGGGALFVAFIHFAPDAIEPPHEIVDPYDTPFLGWLAVAWLLAFIGVLAFTFVYEVRLWHRQRGAATGSADAPPGGAD